MNLSRITVLILTYDERPNIYRTLKALEWAKRIVIVDSGSHDGTLETIKCFANAEIFYRGFDDHAAQWNYGLAETSITTDWVLALDADYIVPAELVEELKRLEPPADVAGYRAQFLYCIDGRALRSSVYPPVTVLYRRDGARYLQDGHTQRISVNGKVENFEMKIRHDDRKPFRRWFESQKRYMRIESRKLVSTPFDRLDRADRLRKIPAVAPVAMLGYCLFAKGLALEGIAGFTYAFQRTIAEIVLSYYVVKRYFGAKP
jgi:glycosyltransferase involved in cell wall biosynthesis